MIGQLLSRVRTWNITGDGESYFSINIVKSSRGQYIYNLVLDYILKILNY